MRNIVFRGKRTDNREWVEGYLYVTHTGEYEIGCYNKEFNIDRWTHIVDPSTVGQFTGLCDKNGKRIFEGDIVKWGHVAGYQENPIRIAEVKINPDIQFDAQLERTPYVFHYGCFIYAKVIDEALEVIGTIHDNPELLKGGE